MSIWWVVIIVCIPLAVLGIVSVVLDRNIKATLRAWDNAFKVWKDIAEKYQKEGEKIWKE